MKTAVVIPSWNAVDFLADCLESLQKQTAKDFGVIVVDNGSTDGSADMVEKSFPNTILVRLDRNYGFAGGVNRGIEKAMAQGAQLIALFNNDAVADPDWLKSLVVAAETHSRAGTVTSKFLHFDDRRTLDSTGDFYSVWGLPFPRGRGEHDHGQYDKARQIFAGSGGASLYRVAMLKQIGLFDEDFFAYWEDSDIGFRGQLAGWEAIYEPKAKAYHHIGGTSSRLGDFARYQTTKNFAFLYLKNMPGWLFWKYLPNFIAGFGLMSLNSISRGQISALFRGWGQIIIKFPAMLSKRRQIQRQRKVSPAHIERLLYKHIPPTSRLLGRPYRVESIK